MDHLHGVNPGLRVVNRVDGELVARAGEVGWEGRTLLNHAGDNSGFVTRGPASDVAGSDLGTGSLGRFKDSRLRDRECVRRNLLHSRRESLCTRGCPGKEGTVTDWGQDRHSEGLDQRGIVRIWQGYNKLHVVHANIIGFILSGRDQSMGSTCCVCCKSDNGLSLLHTTAIKFIDCVGSGSTNSCGAGSVSCRVSELGKRESVTQTSLNRDIRDSNVAELSGEARVSDCDYKFDLRRVCHSCASIIS